MKRYHFWYSERMAQISLDEREELNKCVIKVEGENVELKYTLCHPEYIENGGCNWPDTVYLGVGDISYIGKKKSLEDYYDSQDYRDSD